MVIFVYFYLANCLKTIRISPAKVKIANSFWLITQVAKQFSTLPVPLEH